MSVVIALAAIGIAVAVMSALPMTVVAIVLVKPMNEDGTCVEMHLTTKLIRWPKTKAEDVARKAAERDNPNRQVLIVTGVQVPLMVRYHMSKMRGLDVRGQWGDD